MHYDIKRIYEWPNIPKLIVVGLVSLVVFYLGYLFDISSLNSGLAAAEQQEQELKSEITALAEQQAKLSTQLTLFPMVEKSILDQQKQLISEGELPELLNEVIEIGKLNGVEIINLSPGGVDTKGAYPKVEIKVSISGTFEQIAEFVSQVANLQKMIQVSDMTITKNIEQKKSSDSPDVSTGALTADLNLVVYEAKKT